VCKYPLLFAELLKFTPVNDCPNSHMEIENVLIRLREATAEINRATDDVRMKATLERTWVLQDRLVFSNQVSNRMFRGAVEVLMRNTAFGCCVEEQNPVVWPRSTLRHAARMLVNKGRR
jgi:hypothetical protein